MNPALNSCFKISKKNNLFSVDSTASLKNLKQRIEDLEQKGTSSKISTLFALIVANTEFLNSMIGSLIENLKGQGVGVSDQQFSFEVAKFQSELLALNSLVQEFEGSMINEEDLLLAFRNSELCLLGSATLVIKIGTINSQTFCVSFMSSIEEVQKINSKLCGSEDRSHISTQICSQIGLK